MDGSTLADRRPGTFGNGGASAAAGTARAFLDDGVFAGEGDLNVRSVMEL